jgi:hypothetical protein
VEVLALVLANPRPPHAGVVAKTGPGAMLTGGDATEATAHEDPQPSGIRQTNGRLRKSKRNRKKRQHKEIESPTENAEEVRTLSFELTDIGFLYTNIILI